MVLAILNNSLQNELRNIRIVISQNGTQNSVEANQFSHEEISHPFGREEEAQGQKMAIF